MGVAEIEQSATRPVPVAASSTTSQSEEERTRLERIRLQIRSELDAAHSVSRSSYRSSRTVTESTSGTETEDNEMLGLKPGWKEALMKQGEAGRALVAKIKRDA